MIVELTIVTTPLRKFLQVEHDQLMDLDLRNDTPAFEQNKYTTSWTSSSTWYFDWTPQRQSTVLKRIADFGGTVRFKEEYLPRLHEASWQRTNGVKECS